MDATEPGNPRCDLRDIRDQAGVLAAWQGPARRTVAGGWAGIFPGFGSGVPTAACAVAARTPNGQDREEKAE